ncbi:hypothetical protein N7507_001786 [Penicillium longicatenatum]|nr:hypothetical protein N7507_001786 [Penicillium longicatenatum]
MVYAKPNSSTGAMKRSASALHEGPPGWDVAPPMMTPSRSSARLPYAHFAMIYLDNEGKIKVDESASIQEKNSTLFTSEVRQNFLEILGESVSLQPGARRTMEASPRRVRRRRGNAPGASTIDSRYDDVSDSDDFSPNASSDMVPIRVGDVQKVMSYYEGALKHFQQLNCRMVAKAFIKFIEPRKQVRHPYNGGKPPPGSAPGATGDPEKTKPEWWPPGVMHKEPDHLRKEYRIELLLHIIRKLGGYGITADKLKEVAGDTKRSLKHPSHVEIIYEILRVRKMEERFERGEVDGNMVVFIQNRGPSPKGDGDEDDDSNEPAPLEAPELIEDGLMTPTSSVEHLAPLTTPIDTLPIGGRSLPGSFSMPELTFDGPRQDRPYYTTPPHYTDSFSQPMLSTPVTAEMISPHDVSVFDYSQPPFPNSSPEHQRHQAPGHYDPWGAPTFRQNVFGSVDYGVPTSSQAVTPVSMPYHMPMASPAHLHDMSHQHSHAQSPMDPMSQRALPFRTGSLGHPNPHGLPLSHPA